ncbi:MAG: glutathionylspermidine synthase family protein [Methanococcaceae archaeon]
MKKIALTPRTNWKEKVESLGFTFHSLDNLYWDESSAYEFSLSEILELEAATNNLHSLCLEAVQYIIDKNLFHRFQLSEETRDLIIRSWEEDHPAIYGRFDLGYNASLPENDRIKLLEYNADTPTSLFEAAVVQWHWLQDYNAEMDQFNSIHEKLIAYWKYLIPYFKNQNLLHFACLNENIEDLTTTEYLRDTAIQAGVETKLIYMEHIGYNFEDHNFYDMDDQQIHNLFKLYPWEWLIKEEFAEGLYETPPYFIEPAWKMLLSNKMILVILWEMYPGHKYLLPAFDTWTKFPGTSNNFIAKPVLGREGNNIVIMKNSVEIARTSGNYQYESKIYQQLFDLPGFSGNIPVIGSWVIGGESAGMGIREGNSMITDNTSRFIPHFIKG